MKRNLLLLCSFAFLGALTHAQESKATLLKEFEKQRTENNSKLESLSRKTSQIGKETSQSAELLAGFVENMPYFYTTDDRRSNMASNVEALHNGEIGGLKIDGDGITILVMDGGKVQADHGEFREGTSPTLNRITDLETVAQSYSAHATAVSGFIAAEGRYNLKPVDYPNIPSQFAKGVLPKAKIKHYGFAQTADGSNFQKIIKANENLSNHSYGVNLGWSYNLNGPKGAGWYYPFDNIAPNNPKGTLAGSYYTNDINYDRIVYSDPKFVIMKSSGNYYGDGPKPGDTNPKFKSKNGVYVPFEEGESLPAINCSDGAYCIGWGSLAKNIIVVGATELPTDLVNYQFTGPSSIVMAGFSSSGPRKDGAIKPDITAVGVDVWAPTYSDKSTSSFSRGSGTSYSAPKVTGVTGALTNLKRKLINSDNFQYFADEMKTILLHNTMEAGLFDGPDNKFGWGMLDAKKAAEFVLAVENKTAILSREKKASAEIHTKEVIADGNELKVSISWVDPAGNSTGTIQELLYSTDSKLINDFDLRVVDTETNETFLPWKLDLANPTGAAVKGDNTVDNIEQVQIKSAVKDRKYKVIVSSKGKLVNDSGTETPQNYVIAITGISNAAVLDVKDAVIADELVVYPTIAKEVVNFKYQHKIQRVDVYDISGKLVQTNNLPQNSIAVQSLTPGVYILKITTEKGVVTKKIIKD